MLGVRWCGDRVRTVSRVRIPKPPRGGGGLLGGLFGRVPGVLLGRVLGRRLAQLVHFFITLGLGVFFWASTASPLAPLYMQASVLTGFARIRKRIRKDKRTGHEQQQRNYSLHFLRVRRS